MKATDEQVAVVERVRDEIYPNEDVLRAEVQLELVNWEGCESQRSFMVNPCELRTSLTAILDELKALREQELRTDGSRVQGEMNILVKIQGKTFRCPCGCNVFNKPDATDDDLFQCNGCRIEYRTDGDEEKTNE